MNSNNHLDVDTLLNQIDEYDKEDSYRKASDILLNAIDYANDQIYDNVQWLEYLCATLIKCLNADDSRYKNDNAQARIINVLGMTKHVPYNLKTRELLLGVFWSYLEKNYDGTYADKICGQLG